MLSPLRVEIAEWGQLTAFGPGNTEPLTISLVAGGKQRSIVGCFGLSLPLVGISCWLDGERDRAARTVVNKNDAAQCVAVDQGDDSLGLKEGANCLLNGKIGKAGTRKAESNRILILLTRT